MQEEKTRRETEQKKAKEADTEAAKAQAQAKKHEAECETEEQQAQKDLQSLRDKYRDASHELEQAKRDIGRCESDCLKAYEALPKTFRDRIAPLAPDDWLAVKFPEAADLKNLRREAAEVETHRANLRQAEEVCRVWERLNHQAESSRHSIARLRQELPAGDPAAIRGDHATVQAEETALKNRLAGSRKSLAENQNDVDRFVKEIAQLDKHLAQADSDIRTEEVQRTGGEDAIDRARRQLPEPWQDLVRQMGLSEQHQWNTELRDLEDAKVAERHQQLAKARVGLESLKQDAAEAEAQVGAFPEEHRIPVAEAEQRLQQARAMEAEKEKLLRSVERARGILEQQREEREKLSAQKLEKERDWNFHDLLAKLLGRDRLQRHLVRVAERQIVDYANAVLDRLSAGQLLLKLGSSDEGTPAERALELEAHNRVTGDAPINVKFLSGSQRFRVAVSLALGIGQYASRQHRPIESVIIDEGFGCLDREGRQVMIQELQNLRGQLSCILLVSHQEEFADAFPDGYRFELEEGATRVMRIQR
jgi:DNA repair exonuclease SbcCD ATPase subunit